MEYFKTSVSVRAPLDTLFNFFADPANLHKVSPKRIGLKVEAGDQPLQVGSRVKIRFRVGIIPINWELSVRSLKRGDRFIDWQEQGPFEEWRHSHLFSRDGNTTTVVDMVEYELPYGFLGPLLDKLIIRPAIEKYFRYRQARILELFGDGEAAKPREPRRRGGEGRRGEGRRGEKREERGRRGGRGRDGKRGGEEREERRGRGRGRGRDGKRDAEVRGERGRGRGRGLRDQAELGRDPAAGDGAHSDAHLEAAAGRILERERQERLLDRQGAEDGVKIEPGRAAIDEFSMEATTPEGEGEQPRRRRRRRRGGRGRRRGRGNEGREAASATGGETDEALGGENVSPPRSDAPSDGGRDERRREGRRGRGGRRRARSDETDAPREERREERGREQRESRSDERQGDRPDEPREKAPRRETPQPREAESTPLGGGGSPPPRRDDAIVPIYYPGKSFQPLESTPPGRSEGGDSDDAGNQAELIFPGPRRRRAWGRGPQRVQRSSTPSAPTEPPGADEE